MATNREEKLLKAMYRANQELGVPTDDYPAPVANAHRILTEAIGQDADSEEGWMCRREAARSKQEQRVLAILDDAFHNQGYPLDMLAQVIVTAVTGGGTEPKTCPHGTHLDCQCDECFAERDDNNSPFETPDERVNVKLRGGPLDGRVVQKVVSAGSLELKLGVATLGWYSSELAAAGEMKWSPSNKPPPSDVVHQS